MTWNACKRIVDEATDLGVKEIAISGGEPLCWEHLSSVVAYATSKNINLTLYTTGIAPNAHSIFKTLKNSGLPRVIFSVFGSSSKQHEAVTLTDGSFDGTINAVQKCVALGFEVEFHFVPMSGNYTALRSVAELARGLGVSRVSALRLVPQGRGVKFEGLKLKDEENKSLRQTIIALRNEGYDIRVGSPYNILMLKENPGCCAGIDRMTISPDLKLSPCDAFKQISPDMLGLSNEYSDLIGHSIEECWNKSPYLKKIREYLTSPFANKCSLCGVLENCLSGCVAQKFYSNGTLAKCPDPMCMKIVT
jgi:pyrroloquinoline quinone biosynthesis protein E